MNQIIGLPEKKHDLDLKIAKKYIQDFRNKFPDGHKDGFPHSEAFNKAAILKLLNHPECVGLRIFNGLKTEAHKQEIVFILMGVDNNGKNILSTHTSLKINAETDSGDSPAQENGTKCPPFDDDTQSLE
jgi:hypothetical protein